MLAAVITLAALCVILGVVLAATVIIKNNAYAACVKESDESIDNLDGELEKLKAERDSLSAERASLEEQLAGVVREKEELATTFENSDELYRQLNDKYDEMEASLKDEISERDSRIAKLEDNISKLEKVYLVDINAQFDILNKIETLLAEPVTRVVVTETENPDGTVTETKSEGTPEISLYYLDLVNGYTYSYNADAVMDPASMIKAPYILSLLMAASEEEEKIAAGKAAYDEKAAKTLAAGGVPEAYVEPERVFDMEKKIIYTDAEYYQSGSGEISSSKDGTEYTYKELFYHVLECSDNVAYAILKEEYGNSYYSDLVVSLGAKSLYHNKNGMSAADAGKVMEAIYDFVESDAYYASFMKDAMTESRHLVLIPFAVRPTECIHKYGWDTGSYCDMGVVYSDAPYVLVIMTNYDQGGDEVNTYLRSILSLVNQMHNNFYVQR